MGVKKVIIETGSGVETEEFVEKCHLRCAKCDVFDYLDHVIVRNKRLKRLTELKAPEVMLVSEKRMIQEALDLMHNHIHKKKGICSEWLENRIQRMICHNDECKFVEKPANPLGKEDL